MSSECCGDEHDGHAPPAARLPLLSLVSRKDSAGADACTDACCAPSSSHSDDDDDCCGDGTGSASGAGVEEHLPWWRDPALLPSAASGALLIVGYVLSWLGYDIAGLTAQALALLAGASTFVPGAIRRLRRGKLGVGLLMTIAAVGAVLLGHVGEAAALAFLFSLAETLEDRAMDRAKTGLRALLALIPDTARLSRLGGEVVVRTADVRTLDLLVVGAGERVATDGIVVEGRSGLDTSAVTGESIPVEVGPGDSVAAGSINGAGRLMIEATADGADNSLTQIVALVERAHARKGERARLADRIARPLVPAVLIASALIAVLGSIFGDPAVWIERSLVVLVAASPCALAIAVPVTVISAIGAGSRFGLIIKSGEAFEQLGTISRVALDKTGTLTRNAPQVVEVVVADGFTRDGVLRSAASLESSSTHPLAAAIVAAAPGTEQAADVVESPGYGVAGSIAGRHVRVGNDRWIDPRGLRDSGNALAQHGMTLVLVEIGGVPAGVIGIRDELRPEAPAMIRGLQDLRIGAVMLTGDNAETARAVGAAAGITDIRAEQTPADKAFAVESMSVRSATAMVGDGINDAPALATATVGIAMGLTGSAAAIESADVAFTGNDLRLIPIALRHARRGRRIMVMNIALALAIIIALFPLSLFGLLGLAQVVLVHEAAEVLVILNGSRAARRPAALRSLPAIAQDRAAGTPVGAAA